MATRRKQRSRGLGSSPALRSFNVKVWLRREGSVASGMEKFAAQACVAERKGFDAKRGGTCGIGHGRNGAFAARDALRKLGEKIGLRSDARSLTTHILRKKAKGLSGTRRRKARR